MQRCSERSWGGGGFWERERRGRASSPKRFPYDREKKRKDAIEEGLWNKGTFRGMVGRHLKKKKPKPQSVRKVRGSVKGLVESNDMLGKKGRY